MGFTFEDRAPRIEATKAKYAESSIFIRKQALNTLFEMARSFEKQHDLGLIEWDRLSSLRGQTNATITGLIELMNESGQIDLETCQIWKTHHPHVWVSVSEPRFITEAVHKQFLTILGDITKKNPLFKSLAVQLSKHNWNSMTEDRNVQRAQQESLRGIEDLSSQLRLKNLDKEVGYLWDYYAPPASGKTPSFAWLTDYKTPVIEMQTVAPSQSAPISNVATTVVDEVLFEDGVTSAGSPPDDFFDGLIAADSTSTAASDTPLTLADMDGEPVYSDEDFSFLREM